MKTQIKTVYCRANDSDYFDKQVNKWLKEGWKLGRIELNTSQIENKYTMLFCLLFKQDGK